MDQIVLEHVTKSFTTKSLGTVVAVKDFNLSVKKGECFSFLGPWLRKDYYIAHDCRF